MLSQGDQGEYSAISWLGQTGATVAIVLGNCSDYDVVAEIEGRVARVQVKTTRRFCENRWEVTLATRGGNQSWSGLVKRFSPSRCDYLFVHTAGGRRWFIPSSAVGGGCGLRLGGPKYAAYEIEQGFPLTLS